MRTASKNDTFFWLLNLLVVAIVVGIAVQMQLSGNEHSDYRYPLSQVPHYVTRGFDLDADLSDAVEVPAGQTVGAPAPERNGRAFMQPGAQPYLAFTITAKFDYTAQYNALYAHPEVVPGILLPGLGDSYEIYLNGRLIGSEWHVIDGSITTHRLARGEAYRINPAFFVRGENTLVFRIYGDPTAVDTGLAVTNKYAIDDFAVLGQPDYSVTILAGICLAVFVVFLMLFLLYREKPLNLWFSLTSLSLSMYTLLRAGVFKGIVDNYELALRIEILALISFAYTIVILMYTCEKQKFDLSVKIYTVVYLLFSATLLIPGQQFVLDALKVFLVLSAPFIVYTFVFSLCIPLVKDVRHNAREDGRQTSSGSLTRSDSSVLFHVVNALVGTLRGNLLIGAFLPISFALFEQVTFIFFSYQEIVFSQYSFLFFFVNVTFGLASDIALMHKKLVAVSGELRALVDERESELVRKSGEIEAAKTAQASFFGTISREIRAPLGEIIGAVELRLLRASLTSDTENWLKRLLEMERNLRKKLDHYLDDTPGYAETAASTGGYKFADTRPGIFPSASGAGGTRHLFVINPKSFITLNDLKNFLMSVEMCFSVGHRAEYKVYISRYPRDAYAAVYRYLNATPPDETVRVYAVGGDGILFDCLNGLAKFPNAELAPIPYGNANDFVRSFGADNMHLFRDIKLMSKAPSRLVDLILCGEQYALCSCSIGIEAAAVLAFSKAIEAINSGKARTFVPLLYKLGAVASLFSGTQDKIRYRLTFDGEDFSNEYVFINVGNIALNGGDNIPNPLAVPDDGMLDGLLCTSPSLPHSLKMLPAYTAGQFGKFPDHIKHHRLKEMHCESDSLMSVILDGETFYANRLDLKVLPKAVKIVSPNGIGFADYSQPVKEAAE